MKPTQFPVLLLAASLIACSSSGHKAVETAAKPASGTLVIQPVVFGKDAVVSEAVQKECELPGKLVQFIQENAAAQYASIVTDANSAPADAQVLSIEIQDLKASGGGAWSGPKMVKIKGTLSKNGKPLGDFSGRRTSGGGFFGEYKGTCSILGRCVKTLGADIAAWLQNPVNGAHIGEH